MTTINKKAILLAILLLPLCVADSAAQPKLMSGIYSEGHNLTEPRPSSSKFLETVQGGVVVMDKVAGFFLAVKVKEAPEAAMYIRVDYENPLGGAAATNDMEFAPNASAFTFSSPAHVSGLKNYTDYALTVRVYASKGDSNPVDVLHQKVRSYVDTTGAEIRVFSGLKAGANAP